MRCVKWLTHLFCFATDDSWHHQLVATWENLADFYKFLIVRILYNISEFVPDVKTHEHPILLSLAAKVNGFEFQSQWVWQVMSMGLKCRGISCFFQLNGYAFANTLFSSKRLRSLRANKVIPFTLDMGCRNKCRYLFLTVINLSSKREPWHNKPFFIRTSWLFGKIV